MHVANRSPAIRTQLGGCRYASRVVGIDSLVFPFDPFDGLRKFSPRDPAAHATLHLTQLRIEVKFTVCIKQVPDVSAPSRLDNGNLVQETDRVILNAYDASALEECLVLREKHGGDIDVVLIGPARGAETIRKAMAMGADSGTHIVTDEEDLDSRAYAEILSAFLRAHEADIVACGKQAQDTDSGLTGGMVAELLDLPYATNAVGLRLDDDAGRLVVDRQGDSGLEIIALPLPCLVTCSNDMNDPRIPALKGIMMAKRKPLTELSPDDVLEGGAGLLAALPRTITSGFATPPPRDDVQVIDGEPEEAVDELVRLLSDEQRVL
jgi:electron transfer flavoprotein beta subunit